MRSRSAAAAKALKGPTNGDASRLALCAKHNGAQTCRKKNWPCQHRGRLSRLRRRLPRVLLSPHFAQRFGLTFEPLIQFLAAPNPVCPEMPEPAAQLTPASQHHAFQMIDQRQWADGVHALNLRLVAISDPQLPL